MEISGWIFLWFLWMRSVLCDVDKSHLKPIPSRRSSPYHIGGITNTGDTRVELIVRFFHNNAVKSINLNVNIPSILSPHQSTILSNSMSSGSNSIRHHVPFASVDSSASSAHSMTGRNTMDDVYKTNIIRQGQLIHIVNYAEDKPGLNLTSSRKSQHRTVHNACSKLRNRINQSWIALVDINGPCKDEDKIKSLTYEVAVQPDIVILYSLSDRNMDAAIKIDLDSTAPIIMWLPWKQLEPIFAQCYNSTGTLLLFPNESLSPPQSSNQSADPTNQRSSGTGAYQSLDSHARLVAFDMQWQCNISVKIFISSDDNFLNKTSVLFVSVSFILLMVISLAWLMFYYVQRFRYIHTKEQFSRRLANMAKKAVAKIPVKTLNQGDKETDSELHNCAICIESYRASDTLRILPCKHYFHKSCIDPWLLEQRSCPMCKLNILQAYGFMSADSHASLGDTIAGPVDDEHLSDEEGGSAYEMHLLHPSVGSGVGGLSVTSSPKSAAPFLPPQLTMMMITSSGKAAQSLGASPSPTNQHAAAVPLPPASPLSSSSDDVRADVASSISSSVYYPPIVIHTEPLPRHLRSDDSSSRLAESSPAAPILPDDQSSLLLLSSDPPLNQHESPNNSTNSSSAASLPQTLTCSASASNITHNETLLPSSHTDQETQSFLPQPAKSTQRQSSFAQKTNKFKHRRLLLHPSSHHKLLYSQSASSALNKLA